MKALAKKFVLWLPGLIFNAGLIFFLIWIKQQADAWLWASGLFCSIFLVLPAFFLLIQPDLAIALINSIVALFFMPRMRSSGEIVYKPPAPRLRPWSNLSPDDRILVCILALLGIIVSLAVVRYTFGPALWRWIFVGRF